MTTSNNTTWELTRDNIINSALRKLGALAKGQVADATDLANGSEALNSIIALFETDGMPLWKRVTLPISLINGTNTYNLGSAVKLAQVVLQLISGTTQYPLIEKSYYDFNRLPTTIGGVPVHYYFQPKIQDGTLVIWPTPNASDASTYRLLAVIQKEFDGFFSGSETPDFPPYWTDALIYALAVRLAPEYGVPIQDRQALMQEAKMYFDMASDYGDEDGSMYIMQDQMYRTV